MKRQRRFTDTSKFLILLFYRINFIIVYKTRKSDIWHCARSTFFTLRRLICRQNKQSWNSSVLENSYFHSRECARSREKKTTQNAFLHTLIFYFVGGGASRRGPLRPETSCIPRRERDEAPRHATNRRRSIQSRTHHPRPTVLSLHRARPVPKQSPVSYRPPYSSLYPSHSN